MDFPMNLSINAIKFQNKNRDQRVHDNRALSIKPHEASKKRPELPSISGHPNPSDKGSSHHLSTRRRRRGCPIEKGGGGHLPQPSFWQHGMVLLLLQHHVLDVLLIWTTVVVDLLQSYLLQRTMAMRLFGHNFHAPWSIMPLCATDRSTP